MTTYQIDGWTALADPTRRAIFDRLAEAPQAVVDLARSLPVSRPAVSQHLKVLKDAGLVDVRPDGTRRIYQVSPAGLAELRAQLDRFWSKALAAYSQVVEEPQEEQPQEEQPQEEQPQEEQPQEEQPQEEQPQEEGIP